MTPRFFFDGPLNCGIEIELPKALTHHLRVLRLQEGDLLTLFNGHGGEFQARLSRLTKHNAYANLFDFSPRECELPFKINLIQAIAGGNKMDWLIEKAVELGVHAIQPLQTQRSVVRLSKEREVRRQLHWRAIICAACEQSGRNSMPEIAPVLHLPEWLDQKFKSHASPTGAPEDIYLLLSPRANLAFSQAIKNLALPLSPAATINILIGPEGGLSEEEEIHAERSGFQPVHFGDRILRCETAGLAILAATTALLSAV